MKNIHSSRSALVIIDMQRGLLQGENRPHQAEDVLSRIKTLATRARQSKILTVYVQHYGQPGSGFEQGSNAWHLAEGLHPEHEDWVIQKERSSIFFKTGLRERLAEAGIENLMISGMKTQYCVDTACRIAVELGLGVTLISDAHTTPDTPALSGKAIIEHHNATLNGPFATVQTTEQTLF